MATEPLATYAALAQLSQAQMTHMTRPGRTPGAAEALAPGKWVSREFPGLRQA